MASPLGRRIHHSVGATFSVGQSYTSTGPWARVTLKRYAALMDYETASMRQELVREMGATMPRVGGVPFTGELHPDRRQRPANVPAV